MTVILGWIDGDDAFMCAETAVTKPGPSRFDVSTFGERQISGDRSVEEGAIKLLELPRNTLVGVAGDMNEATKCLVLVNQDLKREIDKDLREILDSLAPAFSSESRFDLLFADRRDEKPRLTVFGGPGQPTWHEVGGVITFLGSLPEHLKTLTAQFISSFMKQPMAAEAKLGASLVLLQSLGMTEYLPEHGIGGAFFGARLSADGVHWQPDLNFFIHQPGAFSSSGVVSGSGSKDGIEKVRTLVREGGGIVLSSLTEPRGRLFIPPNSEKTDDEWKQTVMEATPPPYSLVATGSSYGLLASAYRKGAFVYMPLGHPTPILEVAKVNNETQLFLDQRFRESLERATPAPYFDFTLAFEEAGGTQVQVFRLEDPP